MDNVNLDMNLDMNLNLNLEQLISVIDKLPDFYHKQILSILVKHCSLDVINETSTGVLVVLNELSEEILTEVNKCVINAVALEKNFNIIETEKAALKESITFSSN